MNSAKNVSDVTYNVAYMAINEVTNEIFAGARGQAAFTTKGALKNSMNMRNCYQDKGKYDYKDPEWIFYEINPIDKKLIQVVK